MVDTINLTDTERCRLLDLARMTLEQVVRRQPVLETDESDLPEALRQPAACFVTLSHQGRLRGCIGHLTACRPLHKAVVENTRSAAISDPRFSPMEPSELDGIRIEISVLSDLQPLRYGSAEDLPGLLRPHRDGVVLHLGDGLTTFLPQVWEQIPEPVEFLNRLAQKAGSGVDAWRQPEARISVYRAEVFGEPV